MDFSSFNNKIIITNDKNELIQLRSINPFLNFKIMNKNELLEKIYFSFDDRARIFLHRLGHPYENTNEILSSLYFLKEGVSSKVNHLLSLKKQLEQNNLLIKTPFFKKFFSKQNVLLYNLDNDKELLSICNDSSITPEFINSKITKINNSVYVFDNIEEEIKYIFEQIFLLIKQGIPLNRIKIVCENNTYVNQLKKYEHFYSLKFNTENNTTLDQTSDYKLFSSYLKNVLVEEAFSLIDDRIIYQQEFEKLLSSYIKVKDYINNDELEAFLKHKAKSIKVSNIIYENGIDICSINNCKDDDYVLLIDFSLNNYPKIKKDDDYLLDEEKEKLGINLSYEIQHMNELQFIRKIVSLKNLKISYCKFIDKKEEYISPLAEKLSLPIVKYNFTNVIYSKKHFYFYMSKIIDDYQKYSFPSKYLNSLSLEDINYLSYDNKFTGVPSYSIDSLILSASSAETYNQCGFKYFLSKVLYLDNFEDTIYIKIGKIAHTLLENIVNNIDNDLEKIKKDYDLSNYENIILNILTPSLNKMMENFTCFKESTLLKNMSCEDNKFDYTISANSSLSGRIDLIISNDKYFSIIDHKTGDNKFDKRLVEYGLSNQLPIYYLLTKESQSEYKDKEFLGFYIHHLLNKSFFVDDFSYLLFDGITLSNEALNIIQGNNQFIKRKKDSEITPKEEFDSIIQLAKQSLKQTSENILNGNFSINPKNIKSHKSPCENCPFLDICYKTHKDDIYITLDKEN